MNIKNYTVSQYGEKIADVAVREQAIAGAKSIAKETGRPVEVVAHLSNGRNRKNIYHPDGSVEKTWKI